MPVAFNSLGEPIGETAGQITSAENSNIRTNRSSVEPSPGPARSQSSLGGFGSFENAPTEGQGRPNPLDQYVNYTYGLTLFALSPEEFNGLSAGSTTSGQVLIASGGRRNKGLTRNSEFYEDFYFDNLKMNTVIGMNARSRSSNVIDIQFTVQEPYGISLLNRLLKVAGDLGAENWNEMPFLIQVDFFGNNEDGTLVNPIPDQTKKIPLKLIECKIKVSTKGSEYQFAAVPYHHSAFLENAGTTPAFLEVTAKTVKDFFSSGKDSPGSYTNALNSYQKSLAEKENSAGGKFQEYPDEYEFIIDDEIAEATLVNSKRNNVRSAPTANNNFKLATTSDGIRAHKDPDSPATLAMDFQVTPINAGTSIIDVINQVIRNSSYISDQVGGGGGGTISWYKILPKIEIKEFDKIRKVYQKKYIYYISKIELHNTKYPDAPMSLPDRWSKEYDYVFTGKNQQILDFSIDFNTMFYTVMTAHRDKLKKQEITPDPKAEDEDEGYSNDSGEKTIDPNQVKTVAGQTDVSTLAEGNNDVKNISANDLYKSIMTNSRGDMVNVKLKVSGDPEFIKQDDIIMEPTLQPTVGEVTAESNNSLTTDGGEVYVYLRFRSPSDINQDSGLYDFEKYPDSVFNGLYRVITVENIFERGQFLQNLDLVRLFGQDSGGSEASGAADTGRAADIPSGATAQTISQANKRSMEQMRYAQNFTGIPAARTTMNEISAPPETDIQTPERAQIDNLRSRTESVQPQTATDLNSIFAS